MNIVYYTPDTDSTYLLFTDLPFDTAKYLDLSLATEFGNGEAILLIVVTTYKTTKSNDSPCLISSFMSDACWVIIQLQTVFHISLPIPTPLVPEPPQIPPKVQSTEIISSINLIGQFRSSRQLQNFSSRLALRALAGRPIKLFMVIIQLQTVFHISLPISFMVVVPCTKMSSINGRKSKNQLAVAVGQTPLTI